MTSRTPSSGHDRALPAVTRRGLLRASPALMAPALLAGPALALEPATPILRLYRECETLTARMDDTATSSEEFDRLYALSTELEEQMEEEPVTCMADLAAKVLVLTGLQETDNTIYDPSVRAECEAILAGGAA